MTTYATLKTDVALWLKRSDLTDAIPSLITLAHAEIDNDVRGAIREDDRTLTLQDGSADVPTDFRKLLNASIENSPLIPVDRRGFDGATSQTGQARYYRVRHDKIEVYPVPAADTDMTIVYERSLPALETDTDTNEVLTRFYSLYLYAALKHAAPFLVEDSRIATWELMYAQQLRKVNKQNVRETETASLQLRPSCAVA